jgi:hypothetical protein
MKTGKNHSIHEMKRPSVMKLINLFEFGQTLGASIAAEEAEAAALAPSVAMAAEVSARGAGLKD